VEDKIDQIENRAEILKEVGSLKVVIWECEVTSRTPAPAYRAQNQPARPEEKKTILEKALKGRSVPHRTSFGDASFVATQTIHTKRFEPSAATFVFRYTSEG